MIKNPALINHDNIQSVRYIFLVVMGREFHFPTDFLSYRYISMDNSIPTIKSFSQDLNFLLTHSRAIFKILIHEQTTMHRENKILSCKNYNVGNIVFCRRRTKSTKRKNMVDKSQYASVGPWIITKSLNGGSYEAQHMVKKRVLITSCSQIQPVRLLSAKK